MDFINIEFLDSFLILCFLAVAFVGIIVCFIVLLSILLESTHKIFFISKEYHSYIKYRNDLDYIVYLQEKAEKYNSKELSKKAVWFSKINKKQGD